jgi:hypothetical protein
LPRLLSINLSLMYYTKRIVSWDIDGLFMILSNSLEVGPVPLDIHFL